MARKPLTGAEVVPEPDGKEMSMSWDQEVVKPEYHLHRAKQALEAGRKLPHGVSHSWDAIAYVHCELAIRALGDKAPAQIRHAADDIARTSRCDHSVHDLIGGIEKAMRC